MGHLASTTYTVSNSGGGAFAFLLVVGIAFYILTALGLYGTFVKAGQPGWAGFVPFYNFIILLKVAGRPTTWGWFMLLLIVPYIGTLGFFVVYVIVANDVSKSFGHGPGFTVGLVIPYVSVVFYYILWLGASVYRGPAAAMAGGPGGGYPPPGGYYPPAGQPGYPPAGQPGYPPAQPAYPPAGQPGYPPAQPGYPPAGQAPPPPMPGYPPAGQAPPPPPSAPPTPGQAPPPPAPGQMPPSQ